MMTGYYYLLSFTQGCRDILFILRLLPATDAPLRKWVTQVYLPQKYLLSLCCVETSDVRCLCCAGDGGPSPETLCSLAQEEGLNSSCCPRHRCWTEEFWGTIFLRNKEWSWNSSFIALLLVFLFKHDVLKQWKDIADVFPESWLPIFWLSCCPEMIKYQASHGCLTEIQIKERSLGFVFSIQTL